MDNNNGKFWNLFTIILGAGLLILSIKDFVLPFFMFIVGFMLTNYGLKKMNKPPLIDILKSWLAEFE